MPVPAIVLKHGQVLAQQTASSSLGVKIQRGGLLFGTVVAVYETSDTTSVGDSCLIDTQTATQIKSGADVYYLIDEQGVVFNEGIPV